MSYPSTEKIVSRVVKNYRSAGKALAHAESHEGTISWMNQDTFDDTADAIQGAYDSHNFADVPASEVDGLMEKYGATDIYHLFASYFNATGKILNIVQ